MKDGFKVIDADRHILEPTDLYQNYLPEKFKHRVRLAGPNQTVREVDGKPVSDSALRPGRVMEDYGYIFSSSKRWRECFADAYANKFDPPPICAIWIERASTSPSCFRPSVFTSCGATTSIRN